MFGPGDNVGEKRDGATHYGLAQYCTVSIKIGQRKIMCLTLMHCIGNLCQNVTMYFDSMF